MNRASRARKATLLALLLAVCGSVVVVAAGAAAPTPAAYEDRNNNGIFDAGDVDIANFLRTKWVFNTPHSVVIQGTIKVYDPDVWRCRGLWVTAGNNITVNGSILNPGYAGTIALTAGGSLKFGENVTLNGRTHVALDAGNSIVIGKSVKMYSKGEGAFFYGAVTAMAPHITIGDKYVAQTCDSVKFNALAGNLTFGTGASITTDRLHLTGLVSVKAEGAKLKGKSIISVFSTSGSGPISLRTSKLSVTPAEGSIMITAANGTVDRTGATFNVVPQITASTIIGG